MNDKLRFDPFFSVFDFINGFSSLGSSSPCVVTERLDLNTQTREGVGVAQAEL